MDIDIKKVIGIIIIVILFGALYAAYVLMEGWLITTLSFALGLIIAAIIALAVKRIVD